jgi:hypothetical protein
LRLRLSVIYRLRGGNRRSRNERVIIHRADSVTRVCGSCLPSCFLIAAVVVRINRKRKQYERQGLLVTEEALAKAYRALNRGSAEQNWSSPPKAILELSRILLKFL